MCNEQFEEMNNEKIKMKNKKGYSKFLMENNLNRKKYPNRIKPYYLIFYYKSIG